jgi:hypothetical protein
MASPLSGGVAFAGKSGLNTASACEVNATETIIIAAAHFMSRGLTTSPLRDKENFCALTVIRRGLA